MRAESSPPPLRGRLGGGLRCPLRFSPGSPFLRAGRTMFRHRRDPPPLPRPHRGAGTPGAAHAEIALAELFAAAKAAQANAYAPYSRFECRRGAARGKRRGLFRLQCRERRLSARGLRRSGRDRRNGARRRPADRRDPGHRRRRSPMHALRRLPPAHPRIRRSDDAMHIAGAEGVRRTFTLGELLPESFGPDHLRTA